MPRSKQDIEKTLAETALKLTGQHSWHTLTIEQIAKVAKVSLPDAKSLFPDKVRLLPALVRHIDRKSVSKPDKKSSPRDRLFEAMMARFDVLQDHRKGVLSIVHDSCREPAFARFMLPAQIKSLRQILTQSGIILSGQHEPIALAGLMAVYYRAFWSWQNDKSADMAKTMAALDQGLRFADKAATVLFRNR